MKPARSIKIKTHSDTMVAFLNQALADMIDLKLAAKQAHWNIKGESFIALHELFDKASAEIDQYVDLLAERAVQLGGMAQGTLEEVADRSSLPPYAAATVQDTRKHVEALAAMAARVVENLERGIKKSDAAGDPVTTDILTGIARDLDKLRWFIESNASR